jgi:hypothetical protein
MAIISMGRFTAVGMRVKIEAEDALVINTCGSNDTAQRGPFESWAWCNPTNRAITHHYEGVEAVSVEALWQGTKIFKVDGRPNPQTLAGEWRNGKGKRPIGAWRGEGIPLITSPGGARRAIYVPAFRRLVEHWMKDETVCKWVEIARQHKGPVYLRDHDVGRGIDRNGAMSHAWVLATWLNTGSFPQ